MRKRVSPEARRAKKGGLPLETRFPSISAGGRPEIEVAHLLADEGRALAVGQEPASDNRCQDSRRHFPCDRGHRRGADDLAQLKTLDFSFELAGDEMTRCRLAGAA
jgi:hypothetical protein